MTSEQASLPDVEKESNLDTYQKFDEVTLSEVVDPVLGKTPKRKNDDYWQGNIKWASAKDISQNSTRRIYDTAEYMTVKGKEASNAKIMPEGTVVVIARGSMGLSVQLGEPMTFNQSCYGLEADNSRLLDDFLYYAWQYRFNQIQSVSHGTVFDTITMDSFKDIEIPLPPLEIQRRICKILTCIDNKREVNNEINEILEEMAQTLFRSWFVDFESYNKFKESETGEIPEDFNVVELDQLLSLEYGEGLSKDNRDGGEFSVYGSNGINGSHSEFLINGPGIVVGRKGTIGTVNYEPRNFWCIDTTFYVEPKEDYDMLFYYHLLKNGVKLKHLGSDSAVPGLNRNTVHDQKAALPSQTRIDEFVEIIAPMYELKENIRQENNYLRQLRDTLLPKLMSGEIRVDELGVDSEV